MTNPIHYQNQPIPSYSGVTINISNPTLNAGQNPNNIPQHCNCYHPTQYNMSNPVTQNPYTQNKLSNNLPLNNLPPNYLPPQNSLVNTVPQQQNLNSNENIMDNSTNQHQAYPPQYYLNNYNYVQNGENFEQNPPLPIATEIKETTPNPEVAKKSVEIESFEEDLTTSEKIKNDLDAKLAEEKELEKKGVKTNVVALTNEYIMSLENYLNNPNAEIRLMAAKEVLTRLDEDKERYDDAALNALLNKMLQDPNRLVRLAALSAFSSQLASGNEYTFELLNNIQNDPNANKDDVVQVADCLLKMSSTKETKYIPAKENNDKETTTKPQVNNK